MKSAHEMTAILLIDLQRDFLEPNGRMPVSAADSATVVSIANRLLAYAESAGWKCVFIANEFSIND